MNRPLRPLGVPPNAWAVNAEIADITRPPLEPRLIALPTETKTLRLNLAKAAILVIDMQNGESGHFSLHDSRCQVSQGLPGSSN